MFWEECVELHFPTTQSFFLVQFSLIVLCISIPFWYWRSAFFLDVEQNTPDIQIFILLPAATNLVNNLDLRSRRV